MSSNSSALKTLNPVVTSKKLDSDTLNLWNFMFEYFRFIVLDQRDVPGKEFSVSKEDLDHATSILNKTNLEQLPGELRELVIKAIACTIKGIRNRLANLNPFTSIRKTTEIMTLAKKIHEIKNRKAISRVTFDNVSFTGSEIRLLFGSKFEHLGIDNFYIYNLINTGTRNIRRKPEAVYKESLAKDIHFALKKLSINETSPIISDIFYYAGFLDKHGQPLIASPRTINSYIRRGTTK